MHSVDMVRMTGDRHVLIDDFQDSTCASDGSTDQAHERDYQIDPSGENVRVGTAISSEGRTRATVGAPLTTTNLSCSLVLLEFQTRDILRDLSIVDQHDQNRQWASVSLDVLPDHIRASLVSSSTVRYGVLHHRLRSHLVPSAYVFAQLSKCLRPPIAILGRRRTNRSRKRRA